MNDYIKREDAENKLAKTIKGDTFEVIEEETKKNAAKNFFSDIPSADVVEVVRCKDCEHSKHWYGDKQRCFLWHEGGIDVFDDGFCSYGKKKDEEDTDESVIAEWICLGHRIGYLKHPYSIDYKCSNCGYEEYTLLSYPPERCSKCRAYMKGKEDGI